MGGGAAMKGGAGSFNICKILFLQSHGAYIILFFLSSLFVCICRKYVPYKKCLILMLVQRINELDQGKGEKVSYFTILLVCLFERQAWAQLVRKKTDCPQDVGMILRQKTFTLSRISPSHSPSMC